MRVKDRLLTIISEEGKKRKQDYVLLCMLENGCNSTRELTIIMLEEFIKNYSIDRYQEVPHD